MKSISVMSMARVSRWLFLR